jgi:hypothetical protein
MKIIFCFPFPGFNKSQQELRLYLYPISIGVMRWWEIGLISILHPPSHTLISTGPKGAEFLPHPSSTRQEDYPHFYQGSETQQRDEHAHPPGPFAAPQD